MGAHDGLAAFRLHGDHLRPGLADPAKGLHFVEGLPHADNPDAATGGIEDRVRERPAHLLGELVSHGFLALDAIGLLECADVEPALGDAALH